MKRRRKKSPNLACSFALAQVFQAYVADINDIQTCDKEPLCKSIAKNDEQTQRSSNKDYAATKQKYVADEEGNQRKIEVAKRVSVCG